jgi:hypothetical protein
MKLGYKPSPIHKVGLGPLRDIVLTAGPLPKEVAIVVPPALDQLYEDCVANSGAIVLVHGQAVAAGTPTGPWPELPSRPFLYALLRLASGGSLTDDDGGYIHALVEAIAHSGFPKESQWGPYGGKNPNGDGKDLLNAWPDWQAFRGAEDQKLVKGARRIVSTGDRRVQDVMTALANGSLVQWGTFLDQRFMSLGRDDVWSGVVGPRGGGHAMFLHAYRTPTTHVQIASRSSWKSTFADDGSAWVDESAIASPDAEDFWIWDIAPSYSEAA